MDKKTFSEIKILVIGDVILDKYFIGSVDRISPEAPVPVVNIKERKRVLGGAANVANNILSLNSSVQLVGVTGNDIYQEYLQKILNEKKINAKLIETKNPTTTKIRVVGNNQQVVRLDFEDPQAIDFEIEEQVVEEVKKIIHNFDAIIISDYAKGFCTKNICQFLISNANNLNIPVIVDPKGNDWSKYNGADFVTPNVKELSDIYGKKIINNNVSIEKSGKEILKKYNFNNLLVTRSDKGMTLITNNEAKHFPTEAKEVYDVSGAGDTVVATIAVATAMNMPGIESVELANKAAGVVVSKRGIAPILAKEINSLNNKASENIFSDKNQFKEIVNNLKENQKKIVFTNGCFDVLHRGHITYLKEAKSLGDVLIVGLNTDSSVKRIKGNDRPINCEADRAEVLNSLECVDFVVLFNEDTPFELIKKVKPDLLVKAADYKKEDVIGREFAKETIILDYIEGISSTGIINKFKNNE